MIAITVSTNYEDLLEIVMPQNHNFFQKWYIITRHDDNKTIDVINSFNYDNVVILFYDFTSGGRTFDKGGAVRHCQQNVIPHDYNGAILLLDSDIFLPDNFASILSKVTLENDSLYGTWERHDFHSKDHFYKGIVDLRPVYARDCFGYFQLYLHKSTLLYDRSNNCSHCDHIFRFCFKNRVPIQGLIVKHLGIDRHNWNGRVDHSDFA